MGSIAAVLSQFKRQWREQLDPQLVRRICQDVGYTWRERTLAPWTVCAVFLLQILHGNTACAHLPHLTDLAFSASAYCQARAKLPLEVLRRLVSSLVSTFRGIVAQTELWHGHRLWIADGSSFSMPDTPALQRRFGQSGGQRPGCGFPTASILALFQASTGLLTQVVARPLRVHDLSGIQRLHGQLAAGDVLLGDTGLSSFAHLALLWQRGVHGLFPVHQRQIVSFRAGRAHGRRHSRTEKGSELLLCLTARRGGGRTPSGSVQSIGMARRGTTTESVSLSAFLRVIGGFSDSPITAQHQAGAAVRRSQAESRCKRYVHSGQSRYYKHAAQASCPCHPNKRG